MHTHINVVHSFAAGIGHTTSLGANVCGIAREVPIFCPIIVALRTAALELKRT